MLRKKNLFPQCKLSTIIFQNIFKPYFENNSCICFPVLEKHLTHEKTCTLICNGNKQSGSQIELISIGNEQKNKGAWGQAGSPQLRSHIGCTCPRLVLVWFHHICIKNKTKLHKELATIMKPICLLAGDWMCAHQCVLGSDHNMWLIASGSSLLSVFVFFFKLCFKK